MASIYIYNNNTTALERYDRNLCDPMPYNIGNTLTVQEFMGHRAIGWTDVDTMESWNFLRRAYGHPIHVNKAFESYSDDGCTFNPQHYFGTALTISPVRRSQLELLYSVAVETACFDTVSPINQAMGCFTVSDSFMPAIAYQVKALPYLYLGSRNNYVCGLQSALNFYGESLIVDGIFGPLTDAAVRRFQNRCFITEDGIVARLEWEALNDISCLP